MKSDFARRVSFNKSEYFPVIKSDLDFMAIFGFYRPFLQPIPQYVENYLPVAIKIWAAFVWFGVCECVGT